MLEVKSVRRLPTGMWRYELSDGEVYLVTEMFGWIFDRMLEPVPHPRVEEVQKAIVRWMLRDADV